MIIQLQELARVQPAGREHTENFHCAIQVQRQSGGIIQEISGFSLKAFNQHYSKSTNLNINLKYTFTGNRDGGLTKYLVTVV